MSTPHTGPLALRVGVLRSVATSSWAYVNLLPQFHWVMTMFRSRPLGRGGDGGVSPAEIRRLQSSRASSSLSRPRASDVWYIVLAFLVPWSYASRVTRERVALVPIWWQSMQPPLKVFAQARLASGGLKIDSQ